MDNSAIQDGVSNLSPAERPRAALRKGGIGVPPVGAQVENLCHQIKAMVGSAHPDFTFAKPFALAES